MKFIHIADVHFDSPLAGLAAYKDVPADLLRTVARDTFTHRVDVAVEESVNLMTSAGKNLPHRETHAQA